MKDVGYKKSEQIISNPSLEGVVGESAVWDGP